MYREELETAIELSQLAAKAIMEYYSRGVVAETKYSSGDFAEPVTEADRKASKLITGQLAKAFPSDAILSEEETDDLDKRIGSKRVWIIDPIDGTQGFIKRDGDFSIQIGLVENGRPVLGVVNLPAHNLIYFAAKGEGAFKKSTKSLSDAASEMVKNDFEGQRIHVRSQSDFHKMILAVSRNHRSPKIDIILQGLGLSRELRRGSVGLKIGLIADSECDAYIHLGSRTKLWDICAPEAILNEAGGILTDLWGNRIQYDIADLRNHNGIIAASGAAHAKLLDAIQPFLLQMGRQPYTVITSKESIASS
jgi:3'(2'), 5'-bisphosphate nucleotidase